MVADLTPNSFGQWRCHSLESQGSCPGCPSLFHDSSTGSPKPFETLRSKQLLLKQTARYEKNLQGRDKLLELAYIYSIKKLKSILKEGKI